MTEFCVNLMLLAINITILHSSMQIAQMFELNKMVKFPHRNEFSVEREVRKIYWTSDPETVTVKTIV